MTPRRLAALTLGIALVAGSCSDGGGGASPRGTDSPSASSSPPAASGTPSTSTSTSPTSQSSSPTGSATASTSAGASPDPTSSGTGWGPTEAELRRAEQIAARMSLPQLAGQVIVAEYAGKRPPVSLVNDLHLGGVIVMEPNVGTTAGVRRSNRALQAAVARAGRRWPLFIGVDQEGGIVERMKGAATRFPAFMSAGAARDTRLTHDAAAASAAELLHLGFTAVFAPDGDVTSGPEDPTIGSRSAGSSPALVAHQMNAAVDGYLDAGVLPVIKHFPGHGSVPADSHVELPVQDRSLEHLRRVDLVPFRAGVRRGVPAVMVAHIDVRAVDPGTPSTLSKPVVTGLLRRELGFRGLAVTDAMNMAAVADRFSSAESAVRALAAGNDVVLMPPDPVAARNGIMSAVRDGRLTRARLEEAVSRQVALLLHQAAVPGAGRPVGSGERASYRLSAGAVTVVSGPCRGRLVGEAVTATGPADAVERFYVAARRAGLRTGGGTSVALIGYGGGPTAADVVVAMDAPYPLGGSTGRVARIATYGDTPGAMRALVDVLIGKAEAPGRLPVDVPGVDRRGC